MVLEIKRKEGKEEIKEIIELMRQTNHIVILVNDEKIAQVYDDGAFHVWDEGKESWNFMRWKP